MLVWLEFKYFLVWLGLKYFLVWLRVKVFIGVVRVKVIPGVVRVKLFPILYTCVCDLLTRCWMGQLLPSCLPLRSKCYWAK